MKHIMIDLETLDLSLHTQILSIGVCEFTHNTIERNAEYHLEFYQDRTINTDTLSWHIINNLAYIKTWAVADKHTIGNVMYALSGYIDKDTLVWSKSTDFDIGILKDLYNQRGMAFPWRYNNVRDYRTIAEVFKHIPAENTLPKHSALNDVINQAEHLIKINKEYNFL